MPLVLPIVEAVGTGDTTALLSGVVLSITGIYACLEGVYMHEEEMDRRDSKGPSWIKPCPENLCPIEVQNWALVSESSQERVNWVVSYSWLLTAQTNMMEKLIYLNNWYIEQIDNIVLNGKQNVFFTTNNALKNIIYSLHLPVRKKVKQVSWLKFA